MLLVPGGSKRRVGGLRALPFVVALFFTSVLQTSASRGRKNATGCRSQHSKAHLEPPGRGGEGERGRLTTEAWNGTAPDHQEAWHEPIPPVAAAGRRREEVEEERLEPTPGGGKIGQPHIDHRRGMLDQLRAHLDEDQREVAGGHFLEGLFGFFSAFGSWRSHSAGLPGSSSSSSFADLGERKGAGKGGADECQQDASGEVTGCHLGCSCKWHAACFPKFLPGSRAEDARDLRRHNVGVCATSVPVIVVCSALIVVGTALAVFAIRACLLDWYAELAAKEAEERLGKIALTKMDTGREEEYQDPSEDGRGAANENDKPG